MLINSFDQCAISPFFAKRGTGWESSLVYRRQEADKSTEKLLELLKAAYETKEAIT